MFTIRQYSHSSQYSFIPPKYSSLASSCSIIQYQRACSAYNLYIYTIDIIVQAAPGWLTNWYLTPNAIVRMRCHTHTFTQNAYLLQSSKLWCKWCNQIVIVKLYIERRSTSVGEALCMAKLYVFVCWRLLANIAQYCQNSTRFLGLLYYRQNSIMKKKVVTFTYHNLWCISCVHGNCLNQKITATFW